MKEVYLDNSATTMAYRSVGELVQKVMCEDYGNPSSMHNKGVEAEKYIKEAKETFARLWKVQEKEVYFTSGGTESDNMALIGAARANKRAGNHLITSSIEHPAIINTMRFLEEEGFEITYLPVDANGQISLERLQQELREDTILVSMMMVNNEIGALEPIEEPGKIIKDHNPAKVFHVDALQAYGKFQIIPKRMHIDLLSVSGHKIHAPKGTGFLFIKDKTKVKPLIYGGGQQKGMRSGTENVPGVAALGEAAEEIYENFEEKIDHLYQIKQRFVEGVLKIEGVSVNGKTGRDSAPQIVSVSIDGVRSEVMLHTLEDRKIYVSAGSACSSNKSSVSHTLTNIGLKGSLLDSTIRFSFSVHTTEEEIDYALEVMNEVVPKLRRYTRK